MTYPKLPFALVYILGELTEERSSLRKGPVHISIIAQHDKSVNTKRFEIEQPEHWGAVLRGAIDMFTDHDVDTMTFLYPTEGPADIGVIVEANKPPMVFEWTYSPKFKIIHIGEGEAYDNATKGEGVQEIQRLMNKNSKKPIPHI